MADPPPPTPPRVAVAPHPRRPPFVARSSTGLRSARTASSASTASTSSPPSSPLTAVSEHASNALFGHPGYLPGITPENSGGAERVYPHESRPKFQSFGPSPRSPDALSKEEDARGWLAQTSGAGDPEGDSLRRGSKSVAPSPDFLLKTARFKHTVVDGDNFLLTGLEGTLVRCEDEPIHCPGAVQGFAVLLAFDALPSGRFAVVQVSENSTAYLGIHPSTFFNAHCLTELFGDDEETLRDALAMADDEADEPGVTPFTFELTAGPTCPVAWVAFAAIHRPSRLTKPQRVILELELVNDVLVGHSARRFSNQGPIHIPIPIPSPPATPLESPPEKALGHSFTTPDVNPDPRPGMPSESTTAPSPEDVRLSAVPSIQPNQEVSRLRRLREKHAREAGGGRTGRRAKQGNDLYLVQLMSEIEDEFRKATGVEHFAKIITGVFRELTAFDRVMFDEDWNGEVIAEEVDATRTKDLFRGLHFPSTDIPPQARALYMANKVRLLHNRDEPTARICCRDPIEIARPLDMSHCFSRAMSPIHIQYLSNMGVTSTMSISIVVFGVLWGLVACHHYEPGGFRIAFPMRQLCKLLSDSFGRNIERLIMARRLDSSKKIINTRPTSSHPNGFIVATAENLLALFDADFGCLSIGEEAKVLGVVENSQEILAILAYLRERRFASVISTTDIGTDFPDLAYPSHLAAVAGFLAIPLSDDGRDFIFFCRRAHLTSIKWAGNPYKNVSDCVLDPRTSFLSWSESVMGKCRPWTDELEDTPQALMLIYGRFIDVWREKESLLSAHRIAHHLLIDASEAIRTPLTSVISYLELALDGVLDSETRASVMTSYDASKTLVHVINNLLDMTRAETGRELSRRSPFDISATIAQAVAVHQSEALSRGLSLEITESPSGTPAVLFGDHVQIQRAVTNLISNALRNTKSGRVRVDWGTGESLKSQDAGVVTVGISITDTGTGISPARLELMFREFERISLLGPQTGTSPPNSPMLGSSPPDEESSGVGLGLALVTRIVRTLGGQLRVASRVDEGSRFTLVIPLSLDSGSLPQLDRLDGKGFVDFVRRGRAPTKGIDAMLAELSSTTGNGTGHGTSTRSTGGRSRSTSATSARITTGDESLL